jgi:endonuclease YncB( thermonuclease family)
MRIFSHRREARVRGFRLWVFAMAAALACFADAKEAKNACLPKAGSSHATVTGVNERLELSLADGRILRLAGIEAPGPTPADPDLAARGRDWLKAWIENQDIFFESADSRPDRWGRIPASVFASGQEDGTSLISVEKRLLEQGFARIVPDQHKTPCAELMIFAERGAQTAGLGLWSDPYYVVAAATDADAFAERAGSFIIAEGKLSDVRQISTRTMLFFGPHRRSHLTVTILQRNIKIFEAAGLHFHDLIGQTLRVRGMLETRFGPEIELTQPNEIELIARGSGDTANPSKQISPATGIDPAQKAP